MNGKIQLAMILVLVVLGAGGFGVSFMMSSHKPRRAPADQGVQAASSPAPVEPLAALALEVVPSPESVRLKERQLNELIGQLQAKLAECQQKREELDKRESRLKITQELLAKQVQELENLRVALAATSNSVTSARELLQKSRVVVNQQELANLKHTALIYEKMDATNAGKILEGLCASGQEDDAARILHYMSERSAGKVLGEITDKSLAARLVDRLKRISQEG